MICHHSQQFLAIFEHSYLTEGEKSVFLSYSTRSTNKLFGFLKEEFNRIIIEIFDFELRGVSKLILLHFAPNLVRILTEVTYWNIFSLIYLFKWRAVGWTLDEKYHYGSFGKRWAWKPISVITNSVFVLFCMSRFGSTEKRNDFMKISLEVEGCLLRPWCKNWTM